MTSRRNDKYLLKEENQARALESTKGLRCCQISWTLVHEWLKTGLEFLPTLTILFRPSPTNTLYVALTWRPTATLNETALGSFAAQIWSLKRCYVGNAIASGDLKWQYIAIISTFSSTFILTYLLPIDPWSLSFIPPIKYRSVLHPPAVSARRCPACPIVRQPPVWDLAMQWIPVDGLTFQRFYLSCAMPNRDWSLATRSVAEPSESRLYCRYKSMSDRQILDTVQLYRMWLWSHQIDTSTS